MWTKMKIFVSRKKCILTWRKANKPMCWASWWLASVCSNWISGGGRGWRDSAGCPLQCSSTHWDVHLNKFISNSMSYGYKWHTIPSVRSYPHAAQWRQVCYPTAKNSLPIRTKEMNGSNVISERTILLTMNAKRRGVSFTQTRNSLSLPC